MSNFVPKRHLVSNVTVSTVALVTTADANEYVDGMYVRLFVPAAYGMSIYQSGKISIVDTTNFLITIDTSNQLPFVAPTFTAGGQGFTQAQVIPITGIEDNIEG